MGALRGQIFCRDLGLYLRTRRLGGRFGCILEATGQMNQKLTILVAVAMLGTSGAAYAQASANANATGSTRILQAITITNDAGMNFGSIVKPSNGSDTVSIAASSAGSVTLDTNAATLAAGAGPRSAAKFTVKGEGGQSFSLTVPATFAMTRGGGSETITVTTNNPTGTASTLGGTIGSEGNKEFYVGGSFPISNTTVTGTYSGSFNVVVAYN